MWNEKKYRLAMWVHRRIHLYSSGNKAYHGTLPFSWLEHCATVQCTNGISYTCINFLGSRKPQHRSASRTAWNTPNIIPGHTFKPSPKPSTLVLDGSGQDGMGTHLQHCGSAPSGFGFGFQALMSLTLISSTQAQTRNAHTLKNCINPSTAERSFEALKPRDLIQVQSRESLLGF